MCVINFGRHKGKKLSETTDSHLCWLLCFYNGKSIPKHLVKLELEERGKNVKEIEKEAKDLLKKGYLNKSGFITPKGQEWVKSVRRDNAIRSHIIAEEIVSKILKPISDYDDDFPAPGSYDDWQDDYY